MYFVPYTLLFGFVRLLKPNTSFKKDRKLKLKEKDKLYEIRI